VPFPDLYIFPVRPFVFCVILPPIDRMVCTTRAMFSLNSLLLFVAHHSVSTQICIIIVYMKLKCNSVCGNRFTSIYSDCVIVVTWHVVGYMYMVTVYYL
jgi:hypothetical protein